MSPVPGLLSLRRLLARDQPATRRLGRAGERLAARTLRRAGYRILGKNLVAPMGEADLLCLAPDRRTIVLVEVKTRESPADPAASHPLARPPEAAVDADKRHRLRRILRHLITANNWRHHPARIDVIAIDWPPTPRAQPVIRHYQNI